MRKALDTLYRASGALAAMFIVAIVAVVFAQVLLNLIDKIAVMVRGTAIGLTIPSYSDFTGFFLAAASFLALAYTLRGGAHIRVTLATGLLGPRWQRRAEAFALAVGAALTGFAAVYVIALVLESAQFGDRTSGMVSLPLWMPQAPVAFGLVVLTIALLDDLICVLRGRPPSFDGKGENLLGE